MGGRADDRAGARGRSADRAGAGERPWKEPNERGC